MIRKKRVRASKESAIVVLAPAKPYMKCGIRICASNFKHLLGSGAEIVVGSESYTEGKHWMVGQTAEATLNAIAAAITLSGLVSATVGGGDIVVRSLSRPVGISVVGPPSLVSVVGKAQQELFWVTVQKHDSDPSATAPYVARAFFTAPLDCRIESLTCVPNWDMQSTPADYATIQIDLRNPDGSLGGRVCALKTTNWNKFNNLVVLIDSPVVRQHQTLTLEIVKTGRGAVVPGFTITTAFSPLRDE